MSEEKAPYVVAGTSPGKTSRWVDIRFDDGKHTGVRVRLGTTVIEIQRSGRQKIVDICKPVETIRLSCKDKACYDK